MQFSYLDLKLRFQKKPKYTKSVSFINVSLFPTQLIAQLNSSQFLLAKNPVTKIWTARRQSG